LFTHGSVGNGNDPKEVAFSAGYPELARYFTEQGWQVAVLQRRGRGRSGGLYAEGWQPDRGRYVCEPALARAGLQRGIDDMDAATRQLLTWPDVDRSRLLVGGHSKGGLLAMAFAARQPGRFLGVLNFVGGWVGERCEFAEQINTPAFVTAATVGRPTLWLYGERDPYYSLAHSRKNFEAYRGAGGQGAFEVLSLGPLRNDHQIVRSPAVWQAAMDHYLQTLAPAQAASAVDAARPASAVLQGP
jgi:dienelactone hydrolase